MRALPARAPLQVELHLAYCAWLILQPAALARFTPPTLPPWFAIFADVVRADPTPRRDDWGPSQRYRRAIIHGASVESPFPGELRAKALAVEEAVRQLSLHRLAATGSPGDVCRALGCAPARRRLSAHDIGVEGAA